MLSFFMSVARHAWSTQSNNYAVYFNISRKNWAMKLIFGMLLNMKVFYKLILFFLMGLTGDAQITQVNLKYLCDI